MGRLKQPYTAVEQDLNDMQERFRRAQLKAVRENEAKTELIRKTKEERRKKNKRKSDINVKNK